MADLRFKNLHDGESFRKPLFLSKNISVFNGFIVIVRNAFRIMRFQATADKKQTKTVLPSEVF